MSYDEDRSNGGEAEWSAIVTKKHKHKHKMLTSTGKLRNVLKWLICIHLSQTQNPESINQIRIAQ